MDYKLVEQFLVMTWVMYETKTLSSIYHRYHLELFPKCIEHYWFIIKIIIKKMHIVVIPVQNSQVNKKIGELNFDINNTLQRTNAVMPC